MVRRIGAVLMVVLTASACGRAALIEWEAADSSSGTGGSSSSSSSTSSSGTGGAGGTGGTGGSGWICPSLVLAGPPVGVESPPFGHEQRPQIVLTEEGNEAVTVLFEWMPVESPGPVPSEIRHVTLDPWSTWPPATAPASFVATTEGGHSFAAARSLGSQLAVLYAQGTPNQSTGVVFTEQVMPDVDGAGSQIEVDSQGRRARFAAYMPGTTHLVGYARPAPGGPGSGRELDVTWVHSPPSETLVEPPWVAGCVDGPVHADGIATPDGWLVARATSFGPCEPGVPAEPPLTLNVSWFAGSNLEALMTELPGSEPLSLVELAPRGDGAWLVWRRSPDNMVGALEGARLDGQGALVGEAVTLVGQGSEPRWLDIDGVGDGLAVVWIDTIVNGPPLVAVAAFGGAGDLQAEELVPTTGWAGGEPAIIASPDGRSLLVAWSEQLGDGIADEMMLARLDCVAY